MKNNSVMDKDLEAGTRKALVQRYLDPPSLPNEIIASGRRPMLEGATCVSDQRMFERREFCDKHSEANKVSVSRG